MLELGVSLAADSWDARRCSLFQRIEILFHHEGRGAAFDRSQTLLL